MIKTIIQKIVDSFNMSLQKSCASVDYLTFNMELDGMWYLFSPEWKGSREDLRMKNGIDSLLDFVHIHYPSKKYPSSVKLLVYQSKEEYPSKESNNYIKLAKIESNINGATYEVSRCEDFNKTVLIGPGFLLFCGEYPNYIYIRKPENLVTPNTQAPILEIGTIIELLKPVKIKYLIHFAAPYTSSGTIEVPQGTQYVIKRPMGSDAFYMSLVKENPELLCAMDKQTIRDESHITDVADRLNGYSFFITDQELQTLPIRYVNEKVVTK